MAAPQHQPAWRRMMARRLAIVAGVFAVCVVAVVVRLVILQVFQHDFLTERSREQLEDVIPVPAQRGEILDRHGRVLATSVDWMDICVKRAKITDPGEGGRARCARRSVTATARSGHELARDFGEAPRPEPRPPAGEPGAGAPRRRARAWMA